MVCVVPVDQAEAAKRREAVKEALDAINSGVWESPEQRLDYLRGVFGALGENPYILEPVSFVAGRNLFLGDNVIIGSNSVVNRDVPSNSVVAGAPIRLIRKIEDDTEGAPAAE